MIRLEVDDTVATIILDRPEKLNALTVEMLRQLQTVVDQLDHDQTVRVVLLTAEGDRAFCVGADITAWTALQPLDMWRRWIKDGHAAFDRLAQLCQPVIAVLNGYTLGGGLELALAADIRLAGDHIELGQPEVKLATIPGWGGTQRLPAIVGAGRAKQMIFSGQRIDAATACAWGLVNEVHPADQLMPRAQELAAQIAENAPLAVQFAKQVIDADLTGAPAMVLEALAGALTATTDDAKEGKQAFDERRNAVFKGE